VISGRFDASVECRAVTCLYHGANWWLERAVEDEREMGVDAPESLDWFL